MKAKIQGWHWGVLLLFIAVIMVAEPGGCQTGKVIELIKPQVTEGVSLKQSMADGEDYVTRRGQVNFAAKELVQQPEPGVSKKVSHQAQFSGSELMVSFFQDQEVRITVDSESRPTAEHFILRGRRLNSEIGTFSLAVADGKYLITYHDLESGTLYKVVGDMETGIGQVTEIDQEKIPPMIDAAPLILPGD